MTDSIAAAAQRFAAFLTSRGAADRDILAADITVHRCGFDAERGEIVETFIGVDDVVKWAERSPRDINFAIGTRNGNDVAYIARVSGFVGGGTWSLALNAAGEIVSLRHQPDDLDAARQDAPEWRDAIESVYKARDE